MDIERTVNYVNSASLVHALVKKDVPLLIRGWIEKYLQERILITFLRGAEITARTCSGCPQGGGAVTSPVDRSNDELLTSLTEEAFSYLGYVDDLAFVVRRKFSTTTVELIQVVLDITNEWSKRKEKRHELF